jgi:branched-chain amino acid transport system permease protein
VKPAVIWRAVGLTLLVVVAAAIPLAKNVTVTHVGVFVLLYVGAAVAWNIFSGFTGYISLGAAVFFGVGVYTVALLSKHLNLLGGVVFALYPVGGLVAAVVAVPFGLIALRVRRHTFVVVTIAVFFIFQLMASNFSWTGGATGLYPPFLNWDPNTFDMPFYYTALLIAVGAAVLAWAIWGSRFGLQLRAIRDDEDRARGLGVRTMRVKLAAFVISGFITGTLGGLYFYFQSEALPQYAFNPFFDLTIALMAFLGGFGTLSGPIFGALLLEPYLGYVQSQVSSTFASVLAFGVLFLAVITLVAVGAAVLARAIWGSRSRFPLRAMRDGEDQARGPGVKTMLVKLAPLVISAFIIGILSGLYLYFFYFKAQPGNSLSGAYLSQIVLGALFLAVIILMPRGILPTTGERLTAWRAARARRAAAGGEPGHSAEVPPAVGAVQPSAAGSGASRGGTS